jgi:hypothetical protein
MAKKVAQPMEFELAEIFSNCTSVHLFALRTIFSRQTLLPWPISTALYPFFAPLF